MKITSQKLSWFSQLREQLLEFADEYAKVKFGYSHDMEITGCSPYSITFTMEWYEGCRGHYDQMTESFSILTDVFSDPHWKEKIEAEKLLEELKKQVIQEREKLERVLAKEAKERAELERLKEKYER